MAKVEDLVAKFHSLEGITISERRRNLNKLLDQLQPDLANEENIKSFVDAVVPKSRLEEEFRLDILTRLHRNEELFAVLKSGNPVLIQKLLKNWKFFETTFRTIDAHVFVNDVLPHTSFSTRMKVINRLYKTLKNEGQVDAYFKAIEEKYGLKVALAILPGCSLDLIKSVMQEHKIKLTGRHLLDIVKKDKTFLAWYFELLGDFQFSYYYRQAIKYIAKLDAILFWELFDKYKLKVKFGRHMTPYMVEAKKDGLKSVKDIVNYFNHKQVFVVLKKNEPDFRAYLLDLFPKSSENFVDSLYYIMQAIKYIPKSEQYVLINDCFFETYGKKLIDEKSAIIEELLKIMPLAEREIVLDAKVPDDELLIYLYSPKKSIPMLKDKIKHASEIDKRSKLLCQLVETCRICDDRESLLEVFKYILFRHRNDLYALIDFMRKLSTWPRVENLSAEHWVCINEMLKILAVSGKYSNREFNFMEQYLLHLWKNNRPFDDHIRNFLKFVADNHYGISVFQDQPKQRKMCLEHFGTLIPETFEGEKYQTMCHRFMSAIVAYNKTQPGDTIPVVRYVDMMKTVTETTDKIQYDVKNVINYWVKCSYEDLGIYERFYWEKYKEMHDCSTVIWYIKTNPLKILQNIDKLFADVPESSTCREWNSWAKRRFDQACYFDRIFRLITRYSHLHMPEKLVDFALKSLPDEPGEKFDFALLILSYLGTTQQYLETIRSFEKGKKIKAAVRYLSNVNPPVATLPVLLHFSKKHVKLSLHQIICNTPEKMLAEFFNSLNESTMSVRKHVLYLVITTSTKLEIYKFLKRAGETETNTSLRRVILKLTLKYFVQNPSDTFWDLFKSNISLIDEKDREAHDLLLKLDKVPPNYRAQYVPLIYELLSKSDDRIIKFKRFDFLRSIPNDVITGVDPDFIKRSIRDTLFNSHLQTVDDWVGIKFIFYADKEKRSEMMAVAFDVLRDYVKENWTGLVHADVRSNVCDYVFQFCNFFINLKTDIGLVEEFKTHWSSILAKEEVAEENLLLDFTLEYVRCDGDERMSKFAARVGKILEDFLSNYDASVIDLFSDALIKFFTNLLHVMNNTEMMAEFFENFAPTYQLSYTYVVMMMMSTGSREKLSESVLEGIRNCKVPVVQVYLLRYIKSVT